MAFQANKASGVMALAVSFSLIFVSSVCHVRLRM
jgi:hypothetical protein